jgi:hypothetical protein
MPSVRLLEYILFGRVRRMKPILSYPVWLSAFMILGPFFMVSGAGFRNQRLIWAFQIVGACMVVLALLYLSKRLHEQTEEVASLRQLLNGRDDANRAVPRVVVD